MCLLLPVHQLGSTFNDGRTLATLFTHLERAAAEARLVRRMGYGAHEASCGAGFFGCARCIRQLADVDTRHGIENYRCSETKPEAEELQRFKPSVEAVFILAIPLQSYTMHGRRKQVDQEPPQNRVAPKFSKGLSSFQSRHMEAGRERTWQMPSLLSLVGGKRHRQA